MARPVNAVPSDVYYVATNGNDAWSGTLPDPAPDGSDGPFASPRHAADVLREIKGKGLMRAPTTVYLRGGRYRVEKPVVFRPEDSAPITYAAYEDEKPVIDGGVKVDGWREGEINGVPAWVTTLPEVAGGKWYFKQLFVNGRRRPRARLPKKGLHRIAEVPGMTFPTGWGNGHFDTFRLGDGEMKAFANLADIDIVVYHFWIAERFPVAAFDEKTEMITSTRTSRSALVEAHGNTLAPCFIENVREATTEPGEWYLDRSDGTLSYIPLPGETMEETEIFAPKAKQLLKLEGVPEEGRFVEWLTFRGIGFEHAEWAQPGDEEPSTGAAAALKGRSVERYSRKKDASASQAEADIPGVIQLRGARNCSFEDCRVAGVGWYAIELADGCLANRVVGCELVDLGAGGVKMNGAAFDEPACLRTGDNRVTDNHIHECGRVFYAAVGVLSMHSFGNAISHNHIHDLYYSGISCGWVWGYRPSISRDNHIEKNHIHNLGQGLLSDMGGIYTLGVQPGTVLRGNLIHDVEKLNYGAWCIYPDEGSSHMLIEHNVCYRTNGEIFHQHYGRENIVRNNVFAFGGDSVLAHGRADLGHKAFTMTGNILITDGKPIFQGGYGAPLEARNHRMDHNLIWDVGGKPLAFQQGRGGERIDLEAWHELGHDRHSPVADPKCANPAKGDFSLAEDSPAWEMGFEPIDLSDVGPRPREERD